MKFWGLHLSPIMINMHIYKACEENVAVISKIWVDNVYFILFFY